MTRILLLRALFGRVDSTLHRVVWILPVLTISDTQCEGEVEELTFDVESVLHFSGGMLLGYKHGVKIPESRFYESIGGHFGESVCQLATLSLERRKLTLDQRRSDGTLL